MNTKIESEEEDVSSQPVLVLTPDYYPENEALIDVKVKLECPDISQIETKPDLSSTLITSNLRSLKNETSLVITNVYSIHGGSGFDENNDHPNSLKQEEQPSVYHEYQELVIDPSNPKLNLSLNFPKKETDNPVNNSTSSAFASSTELENHIANNQEQTKFECILCSKSKRLHYRSTKYGYVFLFSSMELLNQHMKAVHNINSTDTNQSHEKKRKLSSELETKSVYESSSTGCIQQTDHVKQVSILKTTGKSKPEAVSPPPTPTDFMCEDCYKTYSRKQLLMLHTSKYHDKKFYCDFCCKSFTKQRELLVHFGPSSLFKFLGQRRLEKTKLDCKICFEPIKSQCELYMHTRCHLKSCQEPPQVSPKFHKRINFECDVCLRGFESELYFVNHKRLVHPNSGWKCSLCPDYFTTYFECRSHRSHSCSSLLSRNIPENPHDDACSSNEEQECNEIESVIEIPPPTHNSTNNTVDYITCDICFATFLTHAGLLCHTRKHHRI